MLHLCPTHSQIVILQFQRRVWSRTSRTGSCATGRRGRACRTRRPSTSSAFRSSRRPTTPRQSARTELGRGSPSVCQVRVLTTSHADRPSEYNSPRTRARPARILSISQPRDLDSASGPAHYYLAALRPGGCGLARARLREKGDFSLRDLQSKCSSMAPSAMRTATRNSHRKSPLVQVERGKAQITGTAGDIIAGASVKKTSLHFNEFRLRFAPQRHMPQ